MARKGQDTLIRTLGRVRRDVPGAVLLLVGDGPYERRLRRTAAEHGGTDARVFAGGHPHGAMPSFYAAADVFAMPCRTRRRGREVEGPGTVFLEAAAAGPPVPVGDSGGAPDAVRDGETGHAVGGRSGAAVAERPARMFDGPLPARATGEKGRHRVRTECSRDRSYERPAGLLGGQPGQRRRGLVDGVHQGDAGLHRAALGQGLEQGPGGEPLGPVGAVHQDHGGRFAA